MDTLETSQLVTIEKLIYGGDGLTRLPSGEVAFVPWTAPGDKARVSLEAVPKKPMQGTVTELVEPSGDRAQPPCSIFGQCGGCQWQHLDLTAQRRWKKQIVEESLSRIGKLQGITVQETIGEDEPQSWHYRNKVQWFITEAAGQVKLGYYKAKSHEVIPFDHCWIIPEPLNQLYQWLVQHLPAGTGLESITARINTQGQLLMVLQGSSLAQEKTGILASQLQQAFPTLGGIVGQEGAHKVPLWGEPLLMETLGGRRFQVSAQSFFQVNPAVTLKLLETLEGLLPKTIETFLDLYAGGGLFSIWLQDRAQAIVAMEEAKTAIADANENLRLNNCQNIQLMPGDVRDVLRHYEWDFKVSLVDPPRTGCHMDVLKWLNQHTQEQIIYISCDPTTLARDLKFLVAEGWQIELVQPFDMFPQTYHVETLVSLKRPPAPTAIG